jgi:hypothetical protein
MRCAGGVSLGLDRGPTRAKPGWAAGDFHRWRLCRRMRMVAWWSRYSACPGSWGEGIIRGPKRHPFLDAEMHNLLRCQGLARATRLTGAGGTMVWPYEGVYIQHS